MGKNLLGNAHMQEMGVHLMGANVKHETKELTPEEIAALNKKMEEEQLLTANRLLELNKGTKDASKMRVAATGYTVIIKPFEKNPYREIKTSASGLILPGDLLQIHISLMILVRWRELNNLLHVVLLFLQDPNVNT